MPKLLLELLSEEIPARMQGRAASNLSARLRLELGTAGFTQLFTLGVDTFLWSTPRRIAVCLHISKSQEVIRAKPLFGPPEGAGELAKNSFASRHGKEPGSLKLIEKDEGKKKALFWHIILPEREVRLRDVIFDVVRSAIDAVEWPKSMRWGEGEARWVRPLHSILCLLDGEVVPVEFAGIVAGRTTFGHSFMAPEAKAPPVRIEVADIADYERELGDAKVMLSAEKRQEKINRDAKELAEEAGLCVRADDELVAEIAGLVEWPVPLIGRINREFMDIPPEVLTTTMRANQKYLALETEDGKLADRFVVVANIEAADGGKAIVAGNERVLRARFWDARHFWEQDERTRLEARLPALERMVFHEKLGTVRERVDRMVALAGALQPYVLGADRVLAERAALLAKCDLVTGMVGEFPELQGVMGGYYARHQAEPEPVASAVAEHYAPKGPDDRCPSAPVSVAIALADKIDSLAGFFAAGIRPTGSKDPFALRRAALGVIRLVVENGLRLPLSIVFAKALDLYGDRFAAIDRSAFDRDINRFFVDRLQVQQRANGIRHDLIAAVSATGQDDDLVRILSRVAALQSFLGTEDGANLLAGWRRATNIVGIEEKKDRSSYQGEPDPSLLSDASEHRLAAALEEAGGGISRALAEEDFVGAMASLAALRPPVDRFFEDVLVNADNPDVRRNRLRLLSTIRTSLGAVADFARVEDP